MKFSCFQYQVLFLSQAIFSLPTSCSTSTNSLPKINYCPPLGPVYAPPLAPSTNASIRAAAANMSTSIQALLSSKNGAAGFNTTTTSFSMKMLSIHEASSASIFEFHHTASVLNSSGTQKVDGGSVYRIGSVSKTITVLELLILREKVRFEDPVTKWVPELAAIKQTTENEVEQVIWEDVTVGNLAGFLAGIVRDYTSGDLSGLPYPWTNLGFPALNSSDTPTCGRDGTQPACSRAEFFTGFTKRAPAYAPFQTPVYSNAAFWILGYVIEGVTGRPYEEVVEQDIFRKLEMVHTSVKKPRDASLGVIPVGDSGWDYDIGGEGSAGGIYSSLYDLSAFCRSILSYSVLPPTVTRQWLKPVSHTASLTYSVGSSWEILRSTYFTPDNRVIDLYTKSGGLGQYGSLIVLIPDYDVALVVLAAGDTTIVDIVSEMVLDTFVPLIDAVARADSQKAYAGKYSSSHSSNSTMMVLTTDSGPGIKVSQWLSEGQDFLALYNSFFGAPSDFVDMRLYPTNLTSTTERAFRAVLQAFSADGSVSYVRGSGILSEPCATWYGIDGYVYGLVGLDDFVFAVEDGRVVALEPRVLRQTLRKGR